jgi:2-iminobutanoate/2-iminopropanoate deaminase
MRYTLLFIVALSMLACGGSRRPAPRPLTEFLTPYGPPTRPFSPAVRVGNLLILSGVIGTTSTGALVTGGIGPETRQALDNIRDVLQRTGSSMERVVKCTVMLADMREWDSMNVVYASYFPGNKPARSSFGVTGLALGARVEIECWATVD